MSKLLLVLLLSTVSLTANAAMFKDDDVVELCRVVTNDPLLRAAAKVYTTAVAKGVSEGNANQMSYRFVGLLHRGGSFGLPNPVYNGYIDNLGHISDFSEAMRKIQTDCRSHLESL